MHAQMIILLGYRKQGKGLFQEALLHKKSRAVGYKGMSYCLILLGGNMLMVTRGGILNM